MKLVHPDIEQHIDFSAGEVWQLCIENPTYLYALATSLVIQMGAGEGDFVLSDKGKEISLPATAQLVLDPFTLNPTASRTVTNKLLAALRAVAFDAEHLQQTTEIVSAVQRYGYDLLDALAYDFETTVSEGFAVDDVLKALKLQIELPDGDLPSRLVEYFAVLRELAGTRLFILLNFSAWLDANDTTRLVRQVAYDGHCLLFIDRNRLSDIPAIVITEENCEL
ncbi:MAG: type II-A CRISPR-associated protein Csn2 [Actinomycetes bacterium]|jgi:CRISPR type II-A-associated protein Csn2|nr:type II-A CRISPR-associated protein Csn2 [Actinomycetes bacterium]